MVLKAMGWFCIKSMWFPPGASTSSFVEELVGLRLAVFLDLSCIECSVGLAKTLMAKTHLSYYSVDL